MSVPVATAPATTKRPGVLTAAIGLAAIAAIAAVVNGIVIATGGTELIKDLLVEAGLPAGMSDAELEMAAQLAGHPTLDDFVNTFAMRGYLSLGAGVALLLFGLLMHKAARWARVLVTISAAATLVFSLVILGDETTTTMAGLAMAAMVGAVLAIVFTWLPANGRYAKARA